MANGQIKQKSIVSNQQPALEQNPEKDILQGLQPQQSQLVQQEAQEPVQQPQKPKYTNLFQAIGNATPQQIFEMKGFAAKQENKRQILRNVGTGRGTQLLELVNSGQMSLKAALDRSKNELSPVMKRLDSVYFNNGTSEDFTKLRTLYESTWTEPERNRWLQLKNNLDSQEDARLAKGNAEALKVAENNSFIRSAQVDANQLLGTFKNIQTFSKNNFTEDDNKLFNTAYTGLNELIYQDISGTPVTSQELNSKLVEFINAIPDKHFTQLSGFYDDEGTFYGIPDKDTPVGQKRNLMADAFLKSISKYRNHLTKINTRGIEEFQGEEPQPEPQPELEKTSSGTFWDN
mgnify:FL=1